MSFVTINIPILVQNKLVKEKEHYLLRPLLFNHIIANDRRFETAISKFKKEVKSYFRGYEMDRANSIPLFWYLFNPSITYDTIHFQFSVGKNFVNGSFGIASFELQEKVFVCLPAFRNYMFMLNKNERGQVNLENATQKAIAHLFRQYKQDNEELEIEDFYASKGEFVSTLKVNVNVEYKGFKFEQTAHQWFFSLMNQNSDFNGAVEIEKVGLDLNALYPTELKRAYYREDLVTRLYNIIYQKENTPLVLIGSEGVGKHTILHEIVWRYRDKNKNKNEEHLQKIWHIDPTRIIAGMSIVGQWQKRFESILKYIHARHKTYAPKSELTDKMIVDNVVAMLRIGKSSQNDMTLSDVLKPYLEKRQLQLIIIATTQEWKIIQEKDRRFSDLFQVVRVAEPDMTTAAKMVLQQRKYLELDQGAEITTLAVNQLFNIHRNYFKRNALPGSVMKLMNQLAVKFKHKKIDMPEVRQEFESYSGINEKIFDTTHTFEENEVFDKISTELVGQSAAVDTLSDVIHSIKARLSDPSKPLGSFLFIGPTGVGKTQAAKVLCQYLMGSDEHLMRFDMNEYIDYGAIQRLIGDYYNPEGQLTGKVRYRPFGVILFDEIEKAHPNVHDLLLQVLDDGRLTDSLGRTVDFSNMIIIMTSNIGAKEASSFLGFDTKNRDEGIVYRKAVENHFRPEFINRIDRIVIFNPLEFNHILNIAKLQIKELLQRDGFVRRTTILNISKEALEWVARRGFNAKMGGRALKRQIERDLTTLSAEQLISTYSDAPIIFNIVLENEKLVPHITELDFTEALPENWIPPLPDETKGKSFYNKLLRRISRIEKDVERMEEDQNIETDVIITTDNNGENLNWQHYAFKDKIAATKERITNLSLGFRDNFFNQGPAIPLRLKRGNIIARRDFSKVEKENNKDKFFQLEALKEISDNYNYAASQFDSLSTEFIDSHISVSFLELFSTGFLKDDVEKVSLHFQSCINGMGEKEIDYLLKLYADLFDTFEIQSTVAEDKHSISAENYALYNFIKGEEGIHLFYRAHKNPLPIIIKLQRENEQIKPINYKVIRIYDGTTLTDLRTGFSNDSNITPAEFKLLLYANIADKQLKNN